MVSHELAQLYLGCRVVAGILFHAASSQAVQDVARTLRSVRLSVVEADVHTMIQYVAAASSNIYG
jgi:hypothetical protein